MRIGCSAPQARRPAVSHDRLVSMANQIGKFFAAQPGGHAADDIALHLKKFWEPRMRQAIVAHLDAGGAGLDPDVRTAVEFIAESPVNLREILLDPDKIYDSGTFRRRSRLQQASCNVQDHENVISRVQGSSS